MAGLDGAAVTREAKSPMTGKGGSVHRSTTKDDGSRPVAVRRGVERNEKSLKIQTLRARLLTSWLGPVLIQIRVSHLIRSFLSRACAIIRRIISVLSVPTQSSLKFGLAGEQRGEHWVEKIYETFALCGFQRKIQFPPAHPPPPYTK